LRLPGIPRCDELTPDGFLTRVEKSADRRSSQLAVQFCDLPLAAPQFDVLAVEQLPRFLDCRAIIAAIQSDQALDMTFQVKETDPVIHHAHPVVREPDAATKRAPQNDQLMSERGILSQIFDLNSEASTARKNQICPIIAPT
jgi:hypothetical protein